MSLSDEVLNKAAAVAPVQHHTPLPSPLLSMLSSQTGRIFGPVHGITAHGLGRIGSSWVSTAHNLPITCEQLQSFLSSERVHALAAQAGISRRCTDRVGSNSSPTYCQFTPNGHILQET